MCIFRSRFSPHPISLLLYPYTLFCHFLNAIIAARHFQARCLKRSRPRTEKRLYSNHFLLGKIRPLGVSLVPFFIQFRLLFLQKRKRVFPTHLRVQMALQKNNVPLQNTESATKHALRKCARQDRRHLSYPKVFFPHCTVSIPTYKANQVWTLITVMTVATDFHRTSL